MSDTEHQISALLGSRICHDLISPLGAIGNGLELLSMAGTAGGDAELALISESVENANARLKFFRVAFGAASSDASDPGAPLAPREVQAILRDYAKSARVTINWQLDSDVPRALVRAAFLLIQCMETAMPYGGSINIDRAANDRWMIEGRAEKMKINMELWEHLSRPGARHPLTPAEVHFGLLHPALTGLGRKLKLEISENVGIRAEF